MLRPGLLSIVPTVDDISEDEQKYLDLDKDAKDLATKKEEELNGALNTSEESYFMLLDAARELSDLNLKKTNLDDAFSGIKHIRDYISNSLDNGGVTATDMKSVVIPVLDHYYNNVDTVSSISVESFSNIQTRGIATSLALESIESVLKNIWESIKKFVMMIFNAIKNLFKAIYKFFVDSEKTNIEIDKKLLTIQADFKKANDHHNLNDILSKDKYNKLSYVDLSDVMSTIIIFNNESNYELIPIENLVSEYKARNNNVASIFNILQDEFANFCNGIDVYANIIKNETDIKNLFQATSMLMSRPIESRITNDNKFEKILENNTNTKIKHSNDNEPFDMYNSIFRHDLIEMNIQLVDEPKLINLTNRVYHYISRSALDLAEPIISDLYNEYEKIIIKPILYNKYSHLEKNVKEYKFFNSNDHDGSINNLTSLSKELSDTLITGILKDSGMELVDLTDNVNKHLNTIIGKVESMIQQVYDKLDIDVVNMSTEEQYAANVEANAYVTMFNSLGRITNVIISKGYNFNNNNLSMFSMYIARSKKAYTALNKKLFKATEIILEEVNIDLRNQ